MPTPSMHARTRVWNHPPQETSHDTARGRNTGQEHSHHIYVMVAAEAGDDYLVLVRVRCHRSPGARTPKTACSLGTPTLMSHQALLCTAASTGVSVRSLDLGIKNRGVITNATARINGAPGLTDLLVEVACKLDDAARGSLPASIRFTYQDRLAWIE
jgi:hypothetical protein